jgi:hypothetical protein
MEYQIRTQKTASGNIAVHVISRPERKLKVEKHIGTGRNTEEIHALKQQARRYIENKQQLQLLPLANTEFAAIEIAAVYHNFIYETLHNCYHKLGFARLNNSLLRDLCIIRIVEPASKIKSIELLQKYFAIAYTRNQLYKRLARFSGSKEKACDIAVNFARQESSLDFNLIFYDVTTLYFESFKGDELRKCGYSKDNKFNQPQIVIALIVDRTGFPIAYEIFEGNKFEGQTFIPTILKFQERYKIQNLTIVADAGMLSNENMAELNARNLRYIVGARLGKLPITTVAQISNDLAAREGRSCLLQTDKGLLVCEYSIKRAYKDRSDRKKQLLRAQREIKQPSRATKKPKFVKVNGLQLEIDKAQLRRAQLLEGIKGYYTNLSGVSPELIIARYKDLWKIEKAFRIAKSDLEVRPVFQWKKVAIESHMLIVFIALCLAKYLENRTGLSIQAIKSALWDIHDVRLTNTTSGYSTTKRMPFNNKVNSILLSANVPIGESQEEISMHFSLSARR